jgi:hypothetical protein
VYDGPQTKLQKEAAMVICPIAIVAGCVKCPAFKVCPLTTVIGDQKAPAETVIKPGKKAASSSKKKKS